MSDADRASEQAIVEVLTEARPGDGLLGEEGTARDTTSGVRWVVDPLDGTTNYLYGLGAWTVSIAAQARDATGWRTVAAAVFEPLSGELFAAEEERGAWLESGEGPGRRASTGALHVNDPVALDRALVGTGFSYDSATRERQGATAAALLPRVRDLRRIGSAARDLSYVAAGRLDGFYESDLGLWDMAAGLLVAREAGAAVSALGRGVVVAGPALHPELARCIATTVPADPS